MRAPHDKTRRPIHTRLCWSASTEARRKLLTQLPQLHRGAGIAGDALHLHAPRASARQPCTHMPPQEPAADCLVSNVGAPAAPCQLSAAPAPQSGTRRCSTAAGRQLTSEASKRPAASKFVHAQYPASTRSDCAKHRAGQAGRQALQRRNRATAASEIAGACLQATPKL